MRTIILEGRLEKVINRTTYEAMYLFRDFECGEVVLNVPKKLGSLYKRINKEKCFRLLAKIEGDSYRKSLAGPIRYCNKFLVIKILK